jgi:hypothetical protein
VAPFLTHLAVGERVWAGLTLNASNDDRQLYPAYYGTFLFGCLAPDVDKFCNCLEQGTTHFVAKDEAGTHVWRRSQILLEQQATLLRAPFCALNGAEQAFVMGYLCHMATDEVTGRMGQAVRSQFAVGGQTLPNVDAIFTAMDARSWHLITEPDNLVRALEMALIPLGTFDFVPAACLIAMYDIVLPQIRERGGLEPYIRMIGRQRHWLDYGRVAAMAGASGLEAELVDFRRCLEADMEEAERLVTTMALGPLLEDAVTHSRRRIDELLTAEDRE